MYGVAIISERAKSGEPLPLVVVAGQVPPPTGGQNVMIQRIFDELSADPGWRAVHLPFYFTLSFHNVRKFRVGKIIELLAVWIRFFRLVINHGPPDLLLYPSGGPQTVPVIRDILLLPLFCAFSRKVVVQFHAAGVSNRLGAKAGPLERLLGLAYRNVAAAIVMTDFNRCDPLSLGIRNIHVIPHRLPDENPEAKLPDYRAFLDGQSAIRNPQSSFNILYAGHLCDLKGTPQLIESFGAIADRFPSARLILMGEFLPPYSQEECRNRCRELGIEDRVEITGVLHRENKAAKFRAAHLFVFPSVAPYESFGLVLVEAMMWGLPIVATDWRGNRDVAGPDACYCPVRLDSLPDLADKIAGSLSSISDLSSKAAHMRIRYEERFRLASSSHDYCAFVHAATVGGNQAIGL